MSEPDNRSLAIRVENLRYAYSNGTVALDDVSFNVREGETVGLVGPGGAGKSTLLLHLNGLLPAALPRDSKSAHIFFQDTPLTEKTAGNIRQRVGLMFQEPDDQLFSGTIADDVAFGPRNQGLAVDEIRQRVADALAAVDLADFERRSPLQLSLGERKRVCLAGLLACRPQILALDEPSSGLDPRAKKQLMQIMRNFSGSRIVASHDLDFIAQVCDRVMILDSGRIQSVGATRDILTDSILMERHGLEVPLRLKFDL